MEANGAASAARAQSMAAAMEVATLHGSAVAALHARGVDRLGDDISTCEFASFLTRPDGAVATLAEVLALGYLWRDLAGEANN